MRDTSKDAFYEEEDSGRNSSLRCEIAFLLTCRTHLFGPAPWTMSHIGDKAADHLGRTTTSLRDTVRRRVSDLVAVEFLVPANVETMKSPTTDHANMALIVNPAWEPGRWPPKPPVANKHNALLSWAASEIEDIHEQMRAHEPVQFTKKLPPELIAKVARLRQALKNRKKPD